MEESPNPSEKKKEEKQDKPKAKEVKDEEETDKSDESDADTNENNDKSSDESVVNKPNNEDDDQVFTLHIRETLTEWLLNYTTIDLKKLSNILLSIKQLICKSYFILP